MSTFAYILAVIGCALIALWLVLAGCFGIGMFWKRGAPLNWASFNANRASVARRFGLTSTPVSRLRWSLMIIASIPIVLFGAVILLIHFFGSLLVVGWCRLTGRPIPQPQSLEDFDDDNVA